MVESDRLPVDGGARSTSDKGSSSFSSTLTAEITVTHSCFAIVATSLGKHLSKFPVDMKVRNHPQSVPLSFFSRPFVGINLKFVIHKGRQNADLRGDFSVSRPYFDHCRCHRPEIIFLTRRKQGANDCQSRLTLCADENTKPYLYPEFETLYYK